MTIVERLQRTGIRRIGTPRTGFRFVHADGVRVGPTQRARLASLKLPPAWSRVAISASPASRVQAVGRDAAGRWQYVYHPTHVRRREEAKFERMLEFGRALPKLRRTVARDLAAAGLGRCTVLACIVRVLGTCFLRPGSEEYADANGTFGLATLRSDHVSVRGATVRFSFTGKAGKPQERELRDARVARIVARLLELPGRELFKYVAQDGTVCDVRRAHINQYLKEVMGRRFSAKDFRTWAGTLICACALCQAGIDVADSVRKRRSKLVAAVTATAAQLGNTPAVCRASYISPVVVSSFERGRVLDTRITSLDDLLSGTDGTALRRCEKALLALLEAGVRRRSSRRAA
ncbi:DNA topoisomerase IB [Candidatus Binatia bacterium]|nr:DNA topoisomerase IB [Candidatus Binatia bacterium]